MKPKNFPRRRKQRQTEAEFRQDVAANTSPKRQLELLDERLGAGVGAKKERAKLQKSVDTG